MNKARAKAGDRPALTTFLHCPHCASEEIVPMRDGDYFDGQHWVECLKCGARGGKRQTLEEATEAWELRA